MSENLPDFLNDNAGVVTGLAGVAVHRNITATNKSLTALRGELGRLQKQFAQEQKKEERESLNRDMLFQIGQQVESITSARPSPDQYFELIRVSDELKSLGLTSRTFNSLQDKSYLSAVSSSIDLALKSCLKSLPEDRRELIDDAVAWNKLNGLVASIARTDEDIAGTQQKIVEVRRSLATFEKSKPHFFSNKIPSILGISGLATGAPLGLLALNSTSQGQAFTFLASMFLGTGVIALTAVLADLDSKKKKRFAGVQEANRRIIHLEDQIAKYRVKRAGFARQLSDLKRIPVVTLQFFQSESTEHTERLNQLKEVSNYLNRVCYALGTDRSKLPGAS
jgi:hypothetical protein